MTYTRPENFITSSGLGTMGFGLPAVGAQVARPTIRLSVSPVTAPS
jgi:acetolactate synthase-1/2/3 large subunit